MFLWARSISFKKGDLAFVRRIGYVNNAFTFYYCYYKCEFGEVGITVKLRIATGGAATATT